MKRWMLVLAAASLAACGDAAPTEPRGPLPPDTTPQPVTPTPKPAPTEVGVPTGDPSASSLIGPDGGTVVSGDGRVVVSVPAGALAAATPVSVLPIRNHAHGGRGTAYRLAPHGVTFAAPVRLTFRYAAADLGGSGPKLLRVAYQDGERRWRMLRPQTVDTVAGTVSVETTHFSDWSLVLGAQLMPPSARVRVGKSVQLRVKDCLPATLPGTDLAPLLYECRDGASAALTGDWYVNGESHGGPEAGAVVPSSTDFGAATYTAPDRVPSRNPVAVSVEYTDLTGARSLLVSNIEVANDSTRAGLTYFAASEYAIDWRSGSERVSGSARAEQSIRTEWTVVPAGREGNRRVFRLEGANRITFSGTAQIESTGAADGRYAASTTMGLRDGGISRNPETATEWMSGMSVAPEDFGPTPLEAGRLRIWQEGERHRYELHYNPSQVVPGYTVETDERWACRTDKPESRRRVVFSNQTRRSEVSTTDPGDCFGPKRSIDYPGPFMFGSLAWNPAQPHPLGGTWTALRGDFDPELGLITAELRGEVVGCMEVWARDATQWGQLVMTNIAAVSPPSDPRQLGICRFSYAISWTIPVPE